MNDSLLIERRFQLILRKSSLLFHVVSRMFSFSQLIHIDDYRWASILSIFCFDIPTSFSSVCLSDSSLECKHISQYLQWCLFCSNVPIPRITVAGYLSNKTLLILLEYIICMHHHTCLRWERTWLFRITLSDVQADSLVTCERKKVQMNNRWILIVLHHNQFILYFPYSTILLLLVRIPIHCCFNIGTAQDLLLWRCPPVHGAFAGFVLVVPIGTDKVPTLSIWMLQEGCRIGLPGWHDWAGCIFRLTVGIVHAALCTKSVSGQASTL